MISGMAHSQGRFGRAKAAAGARWSRLKARRPWVRHAVAAWTRLQDSHGTLYAGAITYFSFLALFPLLLLALSITGFVLHSHPHALHTVFDKITTEIPGSFGRTIKSSLQTAINARAGAGIVGLLGLLLTGLGWIGNLRASVDAVWQHRPAKRNFLMTRVVNLGVLVGLGLGVLISLGLTAVGTSLTDQIVSGLDLGHVPGIHYLVKVVGFALAIGGDLLIFAWVLVRLPAADVPARIGWRAALLASVGFEILKIAGTFTIAHSASSPTAGPFAGLIAVLVWLQLVARWTLYCAAWTATLTAEETEPAEGTAAAEATEATEATEASDGAEADGQGDRSQSSR
jgi:membrane protein